MGRSSLYISEKPLTASGKKDQLSRMAVPELVNPQRKDMETRKLSLAFVWNSRDFKYISGEIQQLRWTCVNPASA